MGRKNLNKARHRSKLNQIVMRDGNRCRYCSRHLNKWEMTVDHVVPKSRNGTNDLGNLVLCCPKCNQAKGNQHFEQFMATRKPIDIVELCIDDYLFNLIKELRCIL